jgi:hypothetical protein
MEKIPLDRLASTACVVDARALPLTRSERLARWRELMLAEGDRLLRPLTHLEDRAPEDRDQCRADGSPLAIAFADPLLRAAGLFGDTVGRAEGFFGLSARETHYILCDCHYLGSMSAARVARRIEAVGQTNPFAKAWRMLMAA